METITREIERALSSGLYYLALVGTLSLPDICGALESSNGEATPQKYKDGCAAWLTSYPQVNSNDLYTLRRGVLHQGRLGHPKSQYSRILFTLPNVQGYIAHRTIINGALNLDLRLFCDDVIEAVRRWYAAKQNDPNVQKNLPKLVQFHENGLAPYIGGIPLIGYRQFRKSLRPVETIGPACRDCLSSARWPLPSGQGMVSSRTGVLHSSGMARASACP